MFKSIKNNTNEIHEAKGVLTHDELEQLSILYDVRLDKILMLQEFFDSKPIGNFVINLDLDSRGGTHYVAVISLRDKIFWSDPFGTINQELKQLLEKYHHKKVIYNNIKVQDINESNCGYWTLIFLKELEHVKTDKEFNNALEECKFYKIDFNKNKNKQSLKINNK